MISIVHTHTGKIYVDKERKLEFLTVGDYGKENNIKADFLGLHKEINGVANTEVDLTKKWVATISTQKGCPMKCKFCDCPRFGFHGNATVHELAYEIQTILEGETIDHTERFNVHFARMGEPTFNPNVIYSAALIGNMIITMGLGFDEYHPVVSTMMPKSNKNLIEFLNNWIQTGFIFGGEDGFGLQFSINTLNEDDRNEMFRNQSLSLQEIGDIINELPMPRKRKYTLNFAVTSKCNLDPKLMDKYFNKEKCIVKITPIHETVEAINGGYEIVTDFDVYEKFEKPLVEDGWDVIVFVPSKEEDSDRITCGNSLIALQEESN